MKYFNFFLLKHTHAKERSTRTVSIYFYIRKSQKLTREDLVESGEHVERLQLPIIGEAACLFPRLSHSFYLYLETPIRPYPPLHHFVVEFVPLLLGFWLMAMVSASATLPPKTYPLPPFFSSFPNSSSFFKIPAHSLVATSTTLTRPLFTPSFVLKDDHCEVIATFDQDKVEDEEEDMREGRETLLYSFTPLPLLLVAALPGGNSIHSQNT